MGTPYDIDLTYDTTPFDDPDAAAADAQARILIADLLSKPMFIRRINHPVALPPMRYASAVQRAATPIRVTISIEDDDRTALATFDDGRVLAFSRVA